MIDGFDVRTLTVVLVLLATIHGIALLCYAKTPSSFPGFKQIGVGFLTLALGFGLISFRGIISDWFTIIISGFVVVSSIALVGNGALRFFDFPSKNYQRLSCFLLLVQVTSFVYFTAYSFDAQWRVAIICTILSLQCFYLSLKLFQINQKLEMSSVRLLCSLLLLCSIVFLARTIWSIFFYHTSTDVIVKLTHISSLLTFLLLLVATSLIIIWIASDRLQKTLKHQATIDPLTQTYNRRALESLARNEIARAYREKRPFSLIIFDIDGFKTINDTSGHQFGDHVLVDICKLVSEHLRPYDILARYGGEEFLLLLPNTCAQDALNLAEKMRCIIAENNFSLPGTDESKKVTASFGVAQSGTPNDSWERLVSKADKALYTAKHEGRNRAVAAA